ncbi:MAG: hypothetical protein AB1832_01065 [Pseudomonadota bacterium]
MPRKSTARSAEALNQPNAGIDEKSLEEAGQALTAHAANLATVEQRFGLNLPYNLEDLIARCTSTVVETASRLIEIGLILIQIREHEAHGTWLASLERIGIGARFAQRAMQTAAKLHDLPRLQTLGVSKVLELVSEDDETLAELEAGGSLAGYTVDELDRMSVRELKAALRAERAERQEEKAADEEIIRAKDERINKLMRDKRKGGAEQALRSRASDLLIEADEAVVEATAQLEKLRRLHMEVEQLYADAGVVVDADIDARMENNAAWASDKLRELAEQLGE